MHDITGYMLCSLELNMQALFMYTYMCLSVGVSVYVSAVQAFIIPGHCINTRADVYFQCVCQQ